MSESAVLPLIPLGFSTDMNLFHKYSVIFLAVRNASATFRYMSHYRWNRPCHGDFSSLMWLSTTWCDFSISPLWHGDDATFPAWCDLNTVPGEGVHLKGGCGSVAPGLRCRLPRVLQKDVRRLLDWRELPERLKDISRHISRGIKTHSTKYQDNI